MKINNIKIQNYRCYKEFELSLGSDVTVIIGKNGAGKSNLISALRKAISFIFAKNKDFEYNLYTSSNSNIRAFEFFDAHFDSLERNYYYPIKIEINGTYLQNSINWSLVKTSSKGKFHSKYYHDIQNSILEKFNNDILNSELPVLAFYSDSFPHILSNVGNIAKKISLTDFVPRDFGYYGWDEQTNCIELWILRYCKLNNFIVNSINELDRVILQYKNISERKEEGNKETLSNLDNKLNSIKTDKRVVEFSNELDYVNKKIILFSEPLNSNFDFKNQDFSVTKLISAKPSNESKETIEFLFADGKTMFFEMLPQGYKRLFSIVIDLAFRSFILNKNRDLPGIVIIDEIELHLHPTLQQEVLTRFIKTFPEIQFIFTTHSPLVISNFRVENEKNKLIKLENKNNIYTKEYVENVYGLDYSTNLSEVMEIAPRSSTIDKYINAYLFLFRKEKIQEANKMLDKLKDYLGGEIPKLLQKEIETQKAQIQ